MRQLFITDAMLAACELPPIIPPWRGPDFESAWPLSWHPKVTVEVPEDPWYQAHLKSIRGES